MLVLIPSSIVITQVEFIFFKGVCFIVLLISFILNIVCTIVWMFLKNELLGIWSDEEKADFTNFTFTDILNMRADCMHLPLKKRYSVKALASDVLNIWNSFRN